MKLYDLFGYREYMQMHDQGYIRENAHPHLDLKIINYTEKAQYDNEWNSVTAQCRGLIVNSKGDIIARPFDKFLNYGQNPNDKLLMDERVIATDKMDGSLGILWRYQGLIGIATRGSFTSDQAVYATNLLDKYWVQPWFNLDKDQTYMFEIIYPENRIVLDYGEMEELVLLGSRSLSDGSVRLPNEVTEWEGPKTQTLSYETLREAVEAPQRFNAEGMVLYFPDLDYRIKLKQDDYIALHKIVTGLTKRRIWENLVEGQTLQDLCELVPDEWHEWLKETYKDLMFAFAGIKQKVSRQYLDVVADLPVGFTQKDFALKVKDMEYSSMLFGIHKGSDINSTIWKLIKPSAE